LSRWELLASPELPSAIRNARSKLRLASEVDLAVIFDALLVYHDGLAFPSFTQARAFVALGMTRFASTRTMMRLP